jgi:hypothetical protein
MIEIKPSYLTQHSVYVGIPLYYLVIRLRHIRQWIAMGIAYCHYKKKHLLKSDKTLFEKLFEDHYDSNTGEISVEPRRFRRGRVLISDKWIFRWKQVIEIMKHSPLPISYVKKQDLFHDVIFNLVNEEVVEPYCSGWWLCGNTYSYVLNRKEYMKEMIADLLEYVYKIKARVVLILPEREYRNNDPEERERFLKLKEIGMDSI